MVGIPPWGYILLAEGVKHAFRSKMFLRGFLVIQRFTVATITKEVKQSLSVPKDQVAFAPLTGPLPWTPRSHRSGSVASVIFSRHGSYGDLG